MKTKSIHSQNALFGNMDSKSHKKIKRKKAYDCLHEAGFVFLHSNSTLSELIACKRSVSALFDKAAFFMKTQHKEDNFGSLSLSAISKASNFFDCFFPLAEPWHCDEYIKQVTDILALSNDKYLRVLDCAFLYMPITLMIFLLDSKINEAIEKS